jgi:hypothetical protein
MQDEKKALDGNIVSKTAARYEAGSLFFNGIADFLV